ncbi:hypothetical protein BSL78_11045 [Apostichopus japonicus]|uniref:DUF4062 domain-containing protein n=1 Tax=Stichopus japonicus TaxID=307972 RepID=A0A2G8KVQ8_STIJA|nr:hypothetical protein BSL78_11045 [Apostichopus japonicus]
MAEKVSHGKITQATDTVSHGTKPTSHGAKVDEKVQNTSQTVEEIVNNCWSEIEGKYVKETSQVKPTTKRPGWRAVRLFVSSTFHDYHSEREVLVKKVFPELKEWCLERQLHLIECDLRWGVPRDSTTAAVLCTCMDEIERCHGDTEGQGMFLNMLGERYGWIPSVTDVPADLAVQFKWVYNTSITHMEILLGAVYRHNRNAAFFIRSPDGWLDKLAPVIQDQFIDRSELGRAQLKMLKTKLRDKYPDQCFDYDCFVEDPEKVESRPELRGLDKFGNNVLSFFKEAIAREYPIVKCDEEEKPGMRVPVQCTSEKDQMILSKFVVCTPCFIVWSWSKKGATVLGRDREYDLILNFGLGHISQSDFEESWGEINQEEKQDSRKPSKEDEESEMSNNRNTIAVIAEPGAGKSSLLAKCAMEACKVKLDAFIHFIGCSGMSTSHVNIMKRICYYLLSTNDPRMDKVSKSEDSNEIEDTLKELLEEKKQSGKKLLILVDDLSQLSKADNYLNWIPKDGVPSNITLVISMVQGDPIVDEVKGHTDNMTWVNLGHLTDKSRYDIVTNYLKTYNKTLDPEQAKLVVESEGAKNALWLSMACEELRVFGVFDLLTQYIKELPSSLDDLLEKILTRLVKEDETDLLKETLCFMECVRDGLRERSLQVMLGDMEAEKCIPMLHLAMIKRTLKPFIRVSSNYQQLDRFTFYHHAIGKAVRKQWLSNEDTFIKHHRSLADYFQYHSTMSTYSPGRRLPYQRSKDGKDCSTLSNGMRGPGISTVSAYRDMSRNISVMASSTNNSTLEAGNFFVVISVLWAAKPSANARCSPTRTLVSSVDRL